MGPVWDHGGMAGHSFSEDLPEEKKNKICWLKMHQKMGFGELVLGVLMAVL